MKRFTETSKWEDGWFSELPSDCKLAWLMLLDKCDNAGVIDRPGRVITALLGLGSFDWDEFRGQCNDGKERIKELDNGKWWLTQFVGFQYKRGVSEASKQHGPIIDSIKRNRLPIEYLKNTHSLPKEEVSDTSQDKDKDKDTDTDTDKSKGTLIDFVEYAQNRGLPANDGEFLFNHFEENGWMRGKQPIRDWKAAMRKWHSARWLPSLKDKTVAQEIAPKEGQVDPITNKVFAGGMWRKRG
jgi:hypothetical protein